ncbi:hypothetical protein OIE66_20305 [Nonomuraea sp. NBC_01738]|uniref:hypothetical protein n=1 Tax=Nonomuraea sp. NBC_01738 TaxID=2976003 RepID=UPI002E0EC059|nr:hypothetical protein OIE66_20305 [Nonomuraea sp. NBC_01738]
MSVVVDAELPPQTAGLLRANPRLLMQMRHGWRPPPVPPPEPRRRRPSGVTLLLATPAVIALIGVLLETSLAPLAFALLGAFVILVLVRISSVNELPDPDHVHERRVYEQARRHQGHYLLPGDFDVPAKAMLLRTQHAVGAVLSSRVNAEGLLDGVRNTVILPAQEWEIARLLAKLSGLRAEHNALLERGVAPEVAAVVRPLERALVNSEAAVLARIEALERYAAHVAEAERAYHARSQIEELRARLPRYEELLAESGADALAVPELENLSDDASRLERALRDSVASAHEAFRHLEG